MKENPNSKQIYDKASILRIFLNSKFALCRLSVLKRRNRIFLNMNIVNLPEEILIIIIKQLDTISLYNLYTACSRIRSIISEYRVVKSCDLSLNTMATVQSLKLNFFKDISRHLQELNLCGINDLTKTLLLPAMNKLKTLKTLNVSYTNISIFDFVELYQNCPSIKNISINFMFGRTTRVRLLQDSLLQCQEVFKNLDFVNFVGNLSNLIYSQLPLYILCKSRLKALQYTVIECDMSTYENEDSEEKVQFDQFSIYFLDGKNSSVYYGFMHEMLLFNVLDFQKYEVIIIIRLNLKSTSLYATPLFEKFFGDNFDLDVDFIMDFSISIFGNVIIMLWNKSTTNFDKSFFENLLRKLRPLFPCQFISSRRTHVDDKYDWFYTTPTPSTSDYRSELCGFSYKKRRVVEPDCILNYDYHFEKKREVQLSLLFNGDIRSGVSFPYDCVYLSKLTYLSMSGTVSYRCNFFEILFSSCDVLVTLNVEAPATCSCYAAVSRYISFSRSLKNLRLVDKRIDFKLVFSSLSECKTLENVNICEMSSNYFDVSDPSILFKKCEKLYCLYAYGPVSDKTRNRKLQILKRARTKCGKTYIKVNLFSHSRLAYDPFIDVFKLNPIKPV
ncbi:uncharacterized protein LOC126771169 [Nymphalis io]|uniref:uncharacterized protein LOC126771169 n=1 Tax=Inachis io TaxID=171585 RepID=UPI00216717E9|nr:uncharacterized protein LOC126771169 [Nymphalis io]